MHKTFAVFQQTPAGTAPPLIVIRAYSLEQARVIAAAMIAGKVIVLAVSPEARR